MRTLILVVIVLISMVPMVGNAQDAPSYYDQVIAADDRTACDETGWSMIESEMTTTMTDSFLVEHAACIGGENGAALLSGCAEPLHQTMIELSPDPGEAWVTCTVMVINGTFDDFVLAPADFSLIDSEGTVYPYSLAASVIGGTSTLQAQELPAGSDPVIGLVAFEIPGTLEAPYLLVWELGVNGVALDPVWIVVDRFVELPSALK